MSSIELFRCNDCGAKFSEPDEVSWKEEMSGDGWAWQTFVELYCPKCGSQNIEKYYGDNEDAETSAL